MKQQYTIFWHRRDLRLHDNAGLYEALTGEHPVLSLFIFDRKILDKLEDKADPRVSFIHGEIQSMKNQLEEMGSTMLVKYGNPKEVWEELLQEWNIASVYTNRDYEPYAKERDAAIQELLSSKDISLHTFKDHVIFEKEEVLKANGTPYLVFTPYSRKWKERLEQRMDELKDGTPVSYYFKPYPNEDYQAHYAKMDAQPMISLEEMGFEQSEMTIPAREVPRGVIRTYDETRNFPALKNGTSRLGIHFRFGTISIRDKALKAQGLNGTYLNELIWRDFYSMILDAYPKTVDDPFSAKYRHIEWRDDAEQFKAWCEGKTGYPLVDAGMRELNATGYMHNRVRMLVASFLTKHLLIHWKLGERYFAEKLLDFELASNVGGWQWAAGTGTDAAPYFRIFSPESQLKKFDKKLEYVRKWTPEYGTDAYPDPIVVHKEARERALRVYKEGLAVAAEMA